jgi:ribosomal-protein-alanine N-acetyltransferase
MAIPKSIVLETPHLRLRIISQEDLPHVFSASRHPGFTDGMLWEPPEKEEDLMAPYLRGIDAWEKGEGYGFTIENKDSSAFLGRISIRKTSTPNLWNLGFWTHPDHQGKGIMSEAVGAMIQLGFEKLDAQEIEACHALWNKASARVLEKNGLQFVRYIKEGFKKHGEWVEENLLSIKRNSWETQKD